VRERWPHVLLHWEDFAIGNANRLLSRYRDTLCTFNDDIQGTAAVTTATLLAAVHATGVPLRDQRIAMFGSGSAGVGIINLLTAAMREQGLSEAEARERIFAFNRHGLLVEGEPGLRESQLPLARTREQVANWRLSGSGPISLLDTVRNAKITALVGTSMQTGAFTEEIVRAVAENVDRPVILPLSNPTSKSEAAPADLLRWSDGRALIGTGSPFAPVAINGRTVRISQTNNSYIFPGLALGILVARARRVTDGMIMAAAKTLASLSPTVADPNDALLPPIGDSRRVGLAVAEAVAKQAMAEGISGLGDPAGLGAELRRYVWEPVYRRYELAESLC
jgi:malate dehydrogenase (oxaloacetate-decarboxylating)